MVYFEAEDDLADQLNHKITDEEIMAAEKILGVHYSRSERPLMAPMLAKQIALALARRHHTIDADASPATVFSPRLQGFVVRNRPSLHIPSLEWPPPEGDEEIAFAPIAAQIGWIRNHQLTARRLTEIYLNRSSRYGDSLRCYARLNDHALERADALDRRATDGTFAGPLHGIPYACKDIIDTEGLITDWGAEPYRGRIPTRNAVVVQRLHDAGAILLGKSSVGALAHGDLWYGGQTRNPWNPEEGSSGSSAGSAAATAAGLCSFSLGTETYGSIILPSTRCGAVGFRPTFSRVSRTGTMALCPSLDKIGLITRTAHDAALILTVINGGDDADVSSCDVPFSGNCGADPRTLRVGYVAADFMADGARPDDKSVLDQCKALGVCLIERERAPLPYESLVSILMAEAAAHFEDLTLSNQDDLLASQSATDWPNQFRAARFLSAVDHVQLDRLRRQAMVAMDNLFRDIDVLIGPSLAGPMLCATNFTGHPCLSLPAYFIDASERSTHPIAPAHAEPDSAVRRVPHSISLWSGLFDEAPMFALASALANQLGLDLRPPGF